MNVIFFWNFLMKWKYNSIQKNLVNSSNSRKEKPEGEPNLFNLYFRFNSFFLSSQQIGSGSGRVRNSTLEWQ